MNFIKLSTHLINISKIIYIKRETTKFIIHLNSSSLNGFLMAGSGNVSSENDKIIIHNNNNDYKIIEDFINKH